MMNKLACPTQALRQFRNDHPEITFIRLQWQDYSGVLRTRVLLFESVIALIDEGKPFQAAGIAIDCTVNNIILHRAPPRGMYWAIPDWSSLRVASHPETALVMCALDYEQHSSIRSDLCPRQALTSVLREARDTWGLDFLVGFEVEFTVMKSCASSDAMVRCSEGFGLFSVAGLRDPCYQYVEQCVRQLRAQGVEILAVHTEGVRGQYEIVLGPLPPTQAIDQLLLVHDYLKDIFFRHGYTVTMSPKPVNSEPLANGQHMHLSLQPASPLLEDSFLAGILKRLPGLCGFCLPLEVSYQRLKPNEAGFSVAWGTDSRLVPIRKVKSSHWEIRCIDVTANMYSTLAAILGAGLLGLAGNEPLIWPDLGVPENQASDCSDPMPQCLEDSLAILEADTGSLATIIGRPMIDHHIKMKRFEIAQVKKLDPKAFRELLIELF
ncbi:glutamine synthetase [Penicillium pulvis]|uniref:glutamine synthetase n=1 Tax=Penicillium pulvis TaxID=1562058 RepID=UPI0025478212|nr:glutamine synthetase [Penicillium pulvis]KAJ5797796.1 glutamine synthetase [Penicillium pulvis]